MKAAIPLFVAALGASAASPKCRCMPGDRCWPQQQQWDRLNSTVGGRLIATQPLGRVCHDPSYIADQCDILRSQWNFPTVHMADSSSIMSPVFQNQSCDPFTPRSSPCNFGNYVRYAVDVRSAGDVAATIDFAKKNNIRLVVRNTGHDYLGRSTAAGALSVWMHKLKQIALKDWTDPFYKGKAVTIGAGVQNFEVLEALKNTGYIVVGGECPTVGPAGGYTQGGGHSALSSSFGLSADNTLEWEVVLANGTFVRASRSQNADLYWALSGGGGGNYGVVTSLTVKAHPDAVVGTALVQVLRASNSDDTFWKAVDAFHAALPALLDAEANVIYNLTKDLLLVVPLTAYNKTASQVGVLIDPFLKALTAMNTTFYSRYSDAPTYYEHYNSIFGPLPYGALDLGVAERTGRVGGRLVPRSVVQRNNAALGRTARSIVEKGATWVGVATNVARFGGQNAVLPAWREALVHVILTTPSPPAGNGLSGVDTRDDLMTKTLMPALEAVTPNSGAYMNEADFQTKNYQQAFFGSNYQRLLGIKRKYDPEGVFQVIKSVGSESWQVNSDGRVCSAA